MRRAIPRLTLATHVHPPCGLGAQSAHSELDEDAFGKLGRAAARQQIAGVMQIGVAQRDALGDLLGAAGLDEY